MALVAKVGEVQAAKQIGLARLTVAKAAAGYPLFPAVRTHIQVKLAELRTEDAG